MGYDVKGSYECSHGLALISLIIASATIRVVIGSVAFEKQVRKEYRLQNCSGHFRMSSSLKDPQCVAVRTGKHCSKPTAVLPLTQRVGRLQSYHIFLSSDEPCWQSCAARGRPRSGYLIWRAAL